MGECFLTLSQTVYRIASENLKNKVKSRIEPRIDV